MLRADLNAPDRQTGRQRQTPAATWRPGLFEV